jgi:hypothetical protein
MLTLRETRLENHHAAALALGRVVPDAAAANNPVHHYAWAHRSHDFAAASFLAVQNLVALSA